MLAPKPCPAASAPWSGPPPEAVGRLAVARDSDFLAAVDEAADRDERVFSAQVVEGGLSATVALSRKSSRKHVGSGPLAIGF